MFILAMVGIGVNALIFLILGGHGHSHHGHSHDHDHGHTHSHQKCSGHASHGVSDSSPLCSTSLINHCLPWPSAACVSCDGFLAVHGPVPLLIHHLAIQMSMQRYYKTGFSSC